MRELIEALSRRWLEEPTTPCRVGERPFPPLSREEVEAWEDETDGQFELSRIRRAGEPAR